jgi:predicted membrane protein
MCAGIAGIITGCALKYCAFLLRRNPSRAIGYIEKIFFVSIALSVANLSFQIWSEKEVLAKMLAKAPVFFWVALLIYCIVMIIGSAGMIFLVLRTISLAKLLTKEIPQQTN